MLAGPSEGQRSLYRAAFVHHCFDLVLRAYRTLNSHSFQGDEEPKITGELVRMARNLLESEDAEQWMEHLEVLDDPPQNLPDRFGKGRRRIDIEFVRTGHGKRPRFHIEAKRLYRSDSVNEYLGTNGLQMFVRAEYAGDRPSAAMLGYVQSDTCGGWLKRLAAGIAARRRDLCICDDSPDWIPARWDTEGLESVHISHHERVPQENGRIQMFHLLLDFT